MFKKHPLTINYHLNYGNKQKHLGKDYPNSNHRTYRHSHYLRSDFVHGVINYNKGMHSYKDVHPFFC